LDALGVTPAEFARQINVPPARVSRIIAGKRAVTGGTALRFGHWRSRAGTSRRAHYGEAVSRRAQANPDGKTSYLTKNPYGLSGAMIQESTSGRGMGLDSTTLRQLAKSWHQMTSALNTVFRWHVVESGDFRSPSRGA